MGELMTKLETKTSRPDEAVIEVYVAFLRHQATVADIRNAIDTLLAAQVDWTGFENNRWWLEHEIRTRTDEQWESDRQFQEFMAKEHPASYGFLAT